MTLTRMFSMMIGLVGIRVAGAVLNLFSQIIFARIFVPHDVGVIFLAMSTASFFGLVGTVGYPWLALTQLPRFSTLGLQKIQRAFHGAFLRDGAAAFIVICILALVASQVWSLPQEVQWALFFGCLATPASMLMRYDSSVATAARRFSLSYVPDFLVRPLLLLAYIVGFELIGSKVSVFHALTAFVVSLHVTNVLQAYILGRDGALPQDFKKARASLTLALRPRAVSLVVVAAVATSFADIVTLVSGFLLPSGEVASVAVAVRLAAIAGFVIQVTQQFVMPDLTVAVTKLDRLGAQHLLLRLNVMTIATLAAALVGTVFLGHWALAIFGASYVEAWPLLVALMVGQSIRAFSGMNQQLLSIAGYQARTAGACLVALVFFVSGGILAVKWFGLLGIGYAVIASELVWSVMLAAQAQSLTGARGDIIWVLKQSLRKAAL